MKAQTSPLRLHEIELFESNYSFVIPEVDEIEDVQELFDSYHIDIDFEHHFSEDNLIMVICEIRVNHGRGSKEGYKLSAEASGVFSIDEKDLFNEQFKQNLQLYSTLNMMINYIRNVFQQQTCQAPMNAYLLPPIDVLKLFKDKQRKPKEK